MIIGIGIDIVKTPRIESMLKKWKDNFMNRVFTQKEVDFCTRKRQPGQHFAIRFAAKEAFLKALGLGMTAGIPWKDIEITNNGIGMPLIELHGKAGETCRKKNVKNVLVSLSHEGEYGVAQVILEG